MRKQPGNCSSPGNNKICEMRKCGGEQVEVSFWRWRPNVLFHACGSSRIRRSGCEVSHNTFVDFDIISYGECTGRSAKKARNTSRIIQLQIAFSRENGCQE